MGLVKKVQVLYDKMPSRKKMLAKGKSTVIATLKATKIKKEDPALKKLGYGLLNFTGHYQVIGCLPGSIQEDLTDDAEIPKTSLTWASIGFGILLGVIKYASGDAVVEADLTLGGYLLQGWGIFRLAEAGIRMTYTSITKKPLGLLAVEMIYKLNPSTYKFKEEPLKDLDKILYENIERLNTECISEYYED